METKDLIKRQLDEMARHKWIESEKVGYDLGEKAMLDWVDKYSEGFEKKTGRKKKSNK